MERPDSPEPPTSPDPNEGPDPEETPSQTAAETPPSGDPDGFELPEWLAFLRNRLILGGLGVLLVLLLTAIVLIAMDGGDDGPTDSFALVQGTATPNGTLTPGPGEELIGRLRVTATLRNGPGTNFAILGTLPAGTTVKVVGRNNDATWLQIIPPSGIQGWVPADLLDVVGDLLALAIGGPGRGPSVAVPTRLPGPRSTAIPPPPPPTARPVSPLPTATSPAPPTATVPAPPPTAPPEPTSTPPGQGNNSAIPPGLGEP